MKAGVFMSEKLDLIYVSSTNVIRAILRSDGDEWTLEHDHRHVNGFYKWDPKAWSHQGGEFVSAQGADMFDGRAKRVTDVPSPCPSAIEYLHDVAAEMTVGGVEAIDTKVEVTAFELSVLRLKAARFDYIAAIPNAWATLAYEHYNDFPAEDEGCMTLEQSIDLGIARSKMA